MQVYAIELPLNEALVFTFEEGCFLFPDLCSHLDG